MLELSSYHLTCCKLSWHTQD